jgi:hypothetical protein
VKALMETRSLAQIRRDAARYDYPSPSLKSGIARIGRAIARGFVYLLLALVVGFFLHFAIGPLLAGISVPLLLLILILNS